MSIMSEKEIVECIKNKTDMTKSGVLSWSKLNIGDRYIMPKELVKELVQQGYVKIIKA